MATPIQSKRETYRLIVLGRDGKEVLLIPDGDRFALPHVEVPRWQRVAENLTAVVRAEWGEELICLFEPNDLPGTNGTGMHYQAAEHWGATGIPKTPTRWVPVSSLSHDSLTDPSDYLAIQQSNALCSAEGKEPPPGPFARLGCFKELREWVEAVIEPLGFHLNRNFSQLNASPSFSLIRFETDGPALWFKAVGEPNQKEFPITCALAQLFPGYVPNVLATRPEWNGWLTPEAAGTLLSEVHEVAPWERAAAALAKLQIDSIEHGARILAAGASDLGVSALSKTVKPFVESMTRLMERQTKVPPIALDRKELLLLGDRIETALEAMEALGIPETLGHLDLNPGNIIAAPGRCAFLDWAEAYVGNPFLTFQYLLEHLRRTMGACSPIETELIASYRHQWDSIVPRGTIDDALALSPLLAIFGYATGSNTWQDEDGLQDQATAGYLRSMTRRMHREANELSERRSLCLP